MIISINSKKYYIRIKKEKERSYSKTKDAELTDHKTSAMNNQDDQR